MKSLACKETWMTSHLPPQKEREALKRRYSEKGVLLSLPHPPLTQTNNPYLESYSQAKENGSQKEDNYLLKYTARYHYVTQYSWAIPTEEALHVILRYSPLLELGCGLGYWASLLQARGADIFPFDQYPPLRREHKNKYHRSLEEVGTAWTYVSVGEEDIVRYFSSRTLFLCWPPYDEPMAYNALKRYQGETLIYIGEDMGGCTGDDKFHDLLHFGEWEEVERVSLPQFYGIHDELFVYKRK